MWDVIDGMTAGLPLHEIARALGVSDRRIDYLVTAISERIPGPPYNHRRERILAWRAKQLGAFEHALGLRDQEGFPIVPLDLPIGDPDSHFAAALHPEA